MAGRRLRVAALGVATAALVGLAACAVPDPFCTVRYSLEVVNDASDRVRVRLSVRTAHFGVQGNFNSGVIALESGAKRTFMVSYGPYRCAALPRNSNKLVSQFSNIHFHDQSAERPYRSYFYGPEGCRDAACETVLHWPRCPSTGTRENLFVESPDRPFYLELDEDDPDLARIVITFVPSAESGTSAGDPSIEVVNDASGRVRVSMAIWSPETPLPSARNSVGPVSFYSGIIALESGENRTIAMRWRPYGCNYRSGNELLGLFRKVEFYDQVSEDPYRSYSYDSRRCDDPDCNRIIHQLSDGTWENLFVESPDRPFYLERDGEDPDLARVVITFVPRTESGERRE